MRTGHSGTAFIVDEARKARKQCFCFRNRCTRSGLEFLRPDCRRPIEDFVQRVIDQNQLTSCEQHIKSLDLFVRHYFNSV